MREGVLIAAYVGTGSVQEGRHRRPPAQGYSSADVALVAEQTKSRPRPFER